MSIYRTGAIKFRSHHFFCALAFEGKGYSDAFVANFQEIVDVLRIEGGEDVEIEVVGVTDSICAPCPNKRGDLCTTQQKIEHLDKAHATALGIKPGDKLTWSEAKQRLSLISMEKHHEICSGCQWLALGICGQTLERLHKSHSSR